MKHHSHRALALLAALVFSALVFSPPTAFAEPWRSHVEAWEDLEGERSQLGARLQSLEIDHQNSVETIEDLRDLHARGQASRRDLDARLRENLRIVEELEALQRELNELNIQQEQLRSAILEGIEDHRRDLEENLRGASTSRRIQITMELNELQQERRRFSAPLPEADQARVAAALDAARHVQDGHPRAMLSAADELEDTEEQLLRRLAALDHRIAELERARQLHRRDQAFAQTEDFFEEDHRSRTIARFEQTVEAEPRQTRPDGRQPPAHTAADDAEFEEDFDSPAEQMPSDEEAAMADPSPVPDDGEPQVGTGEEFGEDNVGNDDPFVPETRTERVVIESEIDPDTISGTSFFSEEALFRDLQRLRRERGELGEQAEELRERARELRDRAGDAR